MNEPLPTIAVDRKPPRTPRSNRSTAAPFAWGVVTGVLLTQALGVILYAMGVLWIGAAQVSQLGNVTPDGNEIYHRIGRLMGEGMPEATGDTSVASVFSISTIYLKVARRPNTHPDVVLAVSRATNTLLAMANPDVSENPTGAKARIILDRFDAEFRTVVSEIKKHEPELARELKRDVQTAVYFQ